MRPGPEQLGHGVLAFRSPQLEDGRRPGLEDAAALAEALERYLPYLEALSQASAPDALPRTKQDRPPAQVTFVAHSVAGFASRRPGLFSAHTGRVSLASTSGWFSCAPGRRAAQREAGHVKVNVPRAFAGSHTHKPASRSGPHPPSALSPSALTAAVRGALLGAGRPPHVPTGPWAEQSILHVRKGPALTSCTRTAADAQLQGRATRTLSPAGTGWARGDPRPRLPVLEGRLCQSRGPGASPARCACPRCGPRGGRSFTPMLRLLQSHLGPEVHSQGRSKETELESSMNF